MLSALGAMMSSGRSPNSAIRRPATYLFIIIACIILLTHMCNELTNHERLKPSHLAVCSSQIEMYLSMIENIGLTTKFE